MLGPEGEDPGVFQAWTVVLAGICYVGLLFAVATWGDRLATQRKFQRRPRPLIYALSLGVYCTSWTYFGSVGISARTGYDFIPVYLGPILVFALAYPLISRVVMIAKTQNIASIADFISARYGKNEALGALVAVIAVIGIVPYISIQLKALSLSLQTLMHNEAKFGLTSLPLPLAGDIALLVTVAMALFAILFGTRHIDTTEHQDGMILAIAVESVMKIVAFVAVGSSSPIRWRRLQRPRGHDPQRSRNRCRLQPCARRWTLAQRDAGLGPCRAAAAAAIHVTVVENAHGSDVRRAAWLFPLYLVLINIFVAPIAITGLKMLPGADADTYVLALPYTAQSHFFTTVAFVGGVSAATAMVIVETIALSIMVSNNIVVPLILLRQGGEQNMFQQHEGETPSPVLVRIRRMAICSILFLAYLYYWLAGNAAALAQTGLISFAAIAQFAPSFLGGLMWRNGTARGAAAGILAGFLLWAYTLLIPSFIDSGWLNPALLNEGLFGIAALKPRQLLGIEFDPLTHGILWSLAANIAAYVGVSALRPPNRLEALQAEAFMPDTRSRTGLAGFRLWRSSVTMGQVEETVARYLGVERTREAFAGMVQMRGLANDPAIEADIGILNFGEHLLASAIGPASSRLVMALLLERHAKVRAMPSSFSTTPRRRSSTIAASCNQRSTTCRRALPSSISWARSSPGTAR